MVDKDKKTKILVLSDHPLHPSGVGIQTRYMIEGMLKTGKYSFICLCGAIKHQDYNPVKTEEWGEDWVMHPVDGYGNPDMIRSLLRTEKPDILWFMTDPRFWAWLWQMENEIRPLVPMVYYHVWDNFPAPTFNRPWYQSNDFIACISKVTDRIIKEVVPDVQSEYLPHAVNTEMFTRYDNPVVEKFKKDHFPEVDNDGNEKMIFFWNNRNARRKQSGTLIFWFDEFLNRIGRDKATLVMHTDPHDVHGQDLYQVINHLGLDNREVVISKDKLPPESIAMLYNMVDCTINISDAEGFGLATFESLSCETPIIVNMTGGLQEQVTDGENWFGFGLDPDSKAIIGSQEIPWIYEDRVGKEQFLDTMEKFYHLPKEERQNMGKLGRQHVLNNYSMDKFVDSWDRIFTDIIENQGSWDTRKNYKSWALTEIK